jgi:hypothetical protein
MLLQSNILESVSFPIYLGPGSSIRELMKLKEARKIEPHP